MKYVYYEHKSPTSLEEQLTFSAEQPYTIRVKSFVSEDVVPLHYGKTIEILLCHNLQGTFRVQNQIFDLSSDQVLVIPPYTLHSNEIPRCAGKMYVLKVSFEDMEQYLDIVHLLEREHISVEQFSYRCPEYDQAMALIEEMMRQDGNFIHCIGCLSQLFGLLGKYVDLDRPSPHSLYLLRNSDMHQLIAWSQQNFQKKIRLEDVASLTGYSKSYFCKRFHALTGMSFFAYLNSVRVEHACLLLKKGKSVSDACYESGFEDVSYFIQIFKRFYKVTPKQYARRLNEVAALSSEPPSQ